MVILSIKGMRIIVYNRKKEEKSPAHILIVMYHAVSVELDHLLITVFSCGQFKKITLNPSLLGPLFLYFFYVAYWVWLCFHSIPVK